MSSDPEYTAEISRRMEIVAQSIRDGCHDCPDEGLMCNKHRNELAELFLNPKEQLKTYEEQIFGVKREHDMRILTCVYCGQEYPNGTPSSGAEVLTEHIRQCEKHPMRKLEHDKQILKEALALHRSMVLGGEQPSELSESMFRTAMDS